MVVNVTTKIVTSRMSGFDKQESGYFEWVPLDGAGPLTTPWEVDKLWNDLSSLPTGPQSANAHLPPLRFESVESGGATDVPKNEWTIAVDLTANLDLGGGVTIGAERKVDDLKRLVELSEGNADVAIVVQSVQSSFADRPTRMTGPKPEGNLDRFIIRDGQITNMVSVASEGLSENHTNLLQYATEFAPSENIGMVINSHGGGPEGLVGGTGRETLQELSSAISRGLEGSGHDALNILDFDACSMATPAVLATLNPVVDYVVASELRERGSSNLNAQNLGAIFSELLKRPHATAEELGQMFVENASDGVTPEVLKEDPYLHGPADVLAAFDTEQYGVFSSALNNLGEVLTEAAKNSTTRHEIEKVFDIAEPLLGGKNYPERRDLSEFVRALQSAAESGKLSDGDDAISKAAQKVIDAQSELTVDVHRTDDRVYDGLEGMYAFLPVKDVRDGLVDGATGLRWLDQFSSRPVKDKDEALIKLDFVADEILGRLSENSGVRFQPVLEDINNIRNAKTDEQIKQSMQALNKTVQTLLKGDLEQELIDAVVQSNEVPMANQWNVFLHSFTPAG